MKAIGIIGYSNSGKTSLLVNLARELTARGYTVSSIKHASEKLDLNSKDTSLHKQFTKQTAAITHDESIVFFSGSKSIEDMLSYMDSDFILIEGFKKEKNYPKIVCLKQNDDPKTLMDGLEICIVGSDINVNMDVPILNMESDIATIADLVEEKSFKLPNLNCGACGYKTCYELALQIVNGSKTVSNCCALNADVQLKINERVIPLNPFVSDLIKNTVTGMLLSLKGYQKGKIEIHIT